MGLPAMEPTLFIDIGSGPGTALMAYADAYPGKVIDYVAIDRAEGMTALAGEVFEGLKTEGMIASASTFAKYSTWDGIAVAKNSATVVFASYFFASNTFPAQCDALCAFMRRLLAASEDHSFTFVYLNSEHNIASQGWLLFIRRMGWDAPTPRPLTVADEPSVRYTAMFVRRKRSS